MKATTKTAQFTPGPWEWQRGERYIKLGQRNAPHESVIPPCDKVRGSKVITPNPANLRLIAAAPAMYEALAKLRLEAIHYRNTGVGKQFLNEAIEQAEQAINQVWGEGNHDTKREG